MSLSWYKFRSQWIPFLFFNILSLYGIYFILRSLSYQSRYPAGDGPHILGVSSRLAQLLVDGEIVNFIYCFSSLLGPHPPFAYVPFIAAELILPNQESTHLVASAFVLWICCDGIRRLQGGIVGLVWFFAGAPIWLQAENAGIDLLAGACAIQAISWLASSKELRCRKSTFLWGAWMGVGFMTKYTAPMFMWAPCIIAAYWIIKRSLWKRLVLSIFAFLIVAGPWWSTHLPNVMGYVSASSNAASGLLTNKNILQGAWYESERLSWYPAAIANAYGRHFIALIALSIILRLRNISSGMIMTLSFMGGWLFLNAQGQRQDRYILPGIPAVAATIGSSWLALPSLYYALPTLRETYSLYTKPMQAPPQRQYIHNYESAGANWPSPSKAYWPVSLDTDTWGVDEALRKARKYQGSDYGTVGFLLEEEGGAPGFGAVLRRATQMGYRWHIATVMVVRPSKNRTADQPLASIFVGPFTFGSWPSRDFNVLLIMAKRPDPQREQWIKSLNLKLAEEWELPKGRTGKIYLK